MMKGNSESGLLCFWGNLKDHPICPHGPTLLFGKYIDGELKTFYACSALREPGQCIKFMQQNDRKNKQSILKRKKGEKNVPLYNHRKLYQRFNQLMLDGSDNRNYCHTCNKLIFNSEITEHKQHDLLRCLTKYQMTHPTEFLKPLNNTKKEAQYFFSGKTTKNIADILIKLGAKHVLCIGVPRLYEYLSHNYGNKINCLLLDFDARFHQFFGPLNYAWYNLFNHHFFSHESKKIFREFLTQGNGEDIYLICDPPFGGRVEPISNTIKYISDSYRKWSNKTKSGELKIFFIFPYFMESIIKFKSNPPGITGGLSTLEMTDFKVDYDNHPVFQEKLCSEKKKKQSIVRLFTNISMSLIDLKDIDGYKYCKECERWVATDNIHCNKCIKCTSKDGRLYKHCDICKRCVKISWEHCEICKRCSLKNHDCNQLLEIKKRCFQHTETGSEYVKTNKSNCWELTEENILVKKKKRKMC